MLSFTAWLIASPAAILTLAFATEVLAGLARGRRMNSPSAAPRSAVIVPAHDEAVGIGRTVTALRAALDDGRILVVADNCSDDTAGIARRAGAEVIVRTDATRRGKGFALAFARDHLAEHSPAVVAVVDADCEMDRRSMAALLAAASDRPAQAVNLLKPDPDAGAMVQVSNFAFLIKNLLRQRGLLRLSGRVHLTGTGMAFPWRLFRTIELATDDLVEDLGLGLDLAASGHRPALVEGATVWSAASTRGGTLQQRKRWEGGFLSTSRRRALPAIASALRRFSAADLWAGLSLLVPPLALLITVDLAIAAATLLLFLVGASPLPLASIAVSIAAAAIALFLAWLRFGRPFLTPKAAAMLPFYLVWKLPLYFGLLRGKPRSWVRTDRR